MFFIDHFFFKCIDNLWDKKTVVTLLYLDQSQSLFFNNLQIRYENTFYMN